MLGIIEACVAYATPVSLLYVHCIGEHEQHNVLNLELALFCLEHRVSAKPLSFVYFLRKKVFAHWYQSDFLCNLFCSCKWKLYHFQFLVFSHISDTFSTLPQLPFPSV